jgi:D-3-phosphoglycerate dehydrogenase
MKQRVLVVLDGTDTARLMFELVTMQAAELNLEIRTVTIDRQGQAGLNNAPPLAEFAGQPEQLLPYMPETDYLLVHLAPVSRSMLEKAPSLRLVGCARSGPVNVDLRAAEERKITVIFAPGRNAEAVADFTFGLLLAVTRHILQAAQVVRDGSWQANTYRKADLLGPELSGKTLGVIGAGDIGRRVIRRALGFGMRVLAFDPYVNEASLREAGAQPSGLAELLASSDYLTLHARPDPSGRPVLGKSEFELVKPGAVLVNTARGALVDEEALELALRSGKLWGAGLDVLNQEPVAPDHPFLKLPNVLVTAHIAGYSSDMGLRAAQMIVDDLIEVAQGRPPQRVARLGSSQ